MEGDRASATARLIALAAVRSGATREGRAELLRHNAEVARAGLRAGGGRDAIAAALATTRAARLAGAVIERVTIPGLGAHYLRRKRLIDGWCSSALDAGFTQVVVLGAGFDALALRLLGRPTPPLCVEIDHPATQRVKRRALDAIGAGNRPRLLEADLSTCDLAALWRGPDLDPGRCTLVVAEGLFMYLPPRRVEDALASLRAAPFPELGLAFTFMDAPAGAPIGFRPTTRLVNRWLRRRGEPFLSSMDGALAGASLSSLGWNLRECVRFTEPAGESAALAERDG